MFKDALRLIRRYRDAVVAHVDRYWEMHDDEFHRLNEMKARLDDLGEKEETVDSIFARSGHSELPRSMTRRINDEMRALKLPLKLRPVITVGGPRKYETRLEDLRSFLFHNLWLAGYADYPEYQDGQFALITVPYLEGTRALWEPFVLGHELAHVKIFHEGSQDVAGVTTNSYLAAIAQKIGLDAADDEAVAWLAEILCDLNALAIYGPAAMASLAEMLAVAGDASHEAKGPGESHPPRALRLRIMRDLLRPVPSEIQGLLAPWESVIEELSLEDRGIQSCSSTLHDKREVLWTEVKAWRSNRGDVGSGVYDVQSRKDQVLWLRERFVNGLPGGLVEENGGDPRLGHTRFEPADIINAAWLAEMDDRNRTDLPDNTLDRLALKALENLDFVSKWQKAAKKRAKKPRSGSRLLELGRAEVDAFLGTSISEGAGILSGKRIKERLSTNEKLNETDTKKVVITPLLAGAIGDAGIDVRLSSSFIVFRHAAIGLFDAIQSGRDPREMQDRVEKSWWEPFVLHPGELVLAATLEYIALPLDLVGHLLGRSSYGRLGLLPATAIQLQPGSKGVVTLELVNLSRTPLALRAGERIGHLVLHELTEPSTEGPKSTTYRYPTGPEFSKVLADWDNEIIDELRLMEEEERSGAAGRVERP